MAKNPSTFKERDDWIVALLAAELPHATARVGIAIAMQLTIKTGECDPPYKTLARASWVSERSIYRHVELLEHAGWIEIERATGCANHFILCTPANPMAEVPARVAADLAEVTTDFGRGTPAKAMAEDPCHTLAEHNVRRAKRTKKGAKTISRAGARSERRPSGLDGQGVDQDFGYWWSPYPRKVARAAALKAYRRIIESGEATPAELLAGCRRYAQQRAGQDPKYTAHAATWLNGKRWRDEPDAPAAATPANPSAPLIGFASVVAGARAALRDGGDQ
jgi:hypothetical protein